MGVFVLLTCHPPGCAASALPTDNKLFMGGAEVKGGGR